MTEWISVKDRLPRPYERVIAAFKDGSVDITQRNSERETSFVYEGVHSKVTHWMPLPEPPKEGNDKGKDSHSFFKCNYSDDINENGWCKYKECHCDGNGDCFAIVFPDKVEQVERKDICKKSSIFGNHYISLTLENLEVLNKGGVLAVLEQEYNIFIELCEHLKAEPPKEEQGR